MLWDVHMYIVNILCKTSSTTSPVTMWHVHTAHIQHNIHDDSAVVYNGVFKCTHTHIQHGNTLELTDHTFRVNLNLQTMNGRRHIIAYAINATSTKSRQEIRAAD